MPSKAPIIVTSIFLVLTLGFAWYAFRSARNTEVSLAALSQGLSRLEANIQEAQKRIVARQRDQVALQARLKSARTLKVAPKVSSAKTPRQNTNPATLTVADPKLRALYLKSIRANLVLRYGSMYQTLGLNQGQIDKFEELSTAQADDVLTMQASALAQGLKLSDPGLIALEKQSKDQFYETVATELGTGVSQQVIQLDRMQSVQGFVNDLSGQTATTSPPLTGWQGTQLVQIMANASTTYQKGGNADPNTISWDGVYAQAAPLLSAPQSEAFKFLTSDARWHDLLNQFYLKQRAGRQ